MKNLILLLTTITTLTGYAQTVEVINKSDFKSLNAAKSFVFIEPSIDSSFFQFVATIRAKDKNKKGVIEKLYAEISKQANKLGANCFKLNSFSGYDSLDGVFLTLDCYFAWDATLNANAEHHEKNVVYVFGEERVGDKTIFFHANGESLEIKAGTYYKFVLREGNELKINKGGLSGAEARIKWEKDKQPFFFALSGFAVLDPTHKSVNEPYQGAPVGVSFYTGKINHIENIDLGLLLTQLLKQCN